MIERRLCLRLHICLDAAGLFFRLQLQPAVRARDLGGRGSAQRVGKLHRTFRRQLAFSGHLQGL